MRNIYILNVKGEVKKEYKSINDFVADYGFNASNISKKLKNAKGKVVSWRGVRFKADNGENRHANNCVKTRVYDRDGVLMKEFLSISDFYDAVDGISVYSMKSMVAKRKDGWLPEGLKVRREFDKEEDFVMSKFSRRIGVVRINLDGKIYESDSTKRALKVNVYYHGELVKTFARASRLASYISSRRMKVHAIDRLIRDRIDGWYFSDLQVRYEGDTDLVWRQCAPHLKAKRSYEDVLYINELGRTMTAREREYAQLHGCTMKEAVEAVADDVDKEEKEESKPARDLKRELEDTEFKIQEIERAYYDRRITVYERNKQLGWLQNHAKVLRQRMSGKARDYRGLDECAWRLNGSVGDAY